MNSSKLTTTPAKENQQLRINEIPQSIRLVLEARHHDPFAVLGRHPGSEGGAIVRAFIPDTAEVGIVGLSDVLPMRRLEGSDLFEWRGPAGELPEHHRLRWKDGSGRTIERHDPYCFAPQLSDFDLYLFGEGKHRHAYRFLGAHPHSIDGVEGVLFATWAPEAERVSVVGDFNGWDGRVHPMRTRGGNGVWELFIPDIGEGIVYKFELRSRSSGRVFLKADPYGQRFEMRPATAALVERTTHRWRDKAWMKARGERDWLHTPMSIYEVHLSSWQRDEAGGFLGYRELADRLVEYVDRLGFTHIELLPVTEHPFDGSWGYQTTGYFAATSRFGPPDDLRYLVDQCHRRGIGVLLDWVPGHFPKDDHALARFDGSALYEHEDPRRGEHRDWGTLIFNYGRNEVKAFLLSSAMYWLEEFHMDGLRVDAVASMLYLDYSREAGEWEPNEYGGNENLEAIAFLRELNQIVHEQHPGALTMAEESTSWPMVSRPTWLGGLGFSMKWNMGWMNDTLQYFQKDPIYRKYHHSLLTFGLVYAFSENFILPLSHDEVVHMKRPMLYKMPGDEWQRFANLRLLYTYMYTHPGKKLLFMGDEFGQGREWDDAGELDWHLLESPSHQGIQRLVGDLNRLYRDNGALCRYDFDARGFEWIDCNDSEQSLISYVRRDEEEQFVVALNFTPAPREGYRLGVPAPGDYDVVFNSDSTYYGGTNMGNAGVLGSETVPWMGREHSIVLTLPPLAGVVLRRRGD